MKSVLLLLVLFTLSFGWKHTVDTTKYRKIGSDSLLYVDPDDSLLKTTKIKYDDVTDYTYFPDFLLLDSNVTGTFGFLAKNSDQGIYLGTGKGSYDPDSGACIGIYGYNYPTGLPGWASINSAGNGRIFLNAPWVNFGWGDTSSTYMNIHPYGGEGGYARISGVHGYEIDINMCLQTNGAKVEIPETLSVTNGFSIGSSGDYFHGIEIIDDTNDTLQLIIGTDTFYVEVDKR